jgi:DNA-binding response OmpR family regulator
MAEESSNNRIVKVGNNSVKHYSNALIRRAIEDIGLNSTRIFSLSSLKKEILVIGYPGEIGLLISEWLRSEGFNPSLNESMEYEAPFDKIFAQLTEKQYDLVIVTYWAYYRILPELQHRFPKVNVIFLNSYSSDLDSFAQQYGVKDILRMPFEWDDLISRIKNVFLE